MTCAQPSSQAAPFQELIVTFQHVVEFFRVDWLGFFIGAVGFVEAIYCGVEFPK
jgi:hypothetical protein